MVPGVGRLLVALLALLCSCGTVAPATCRLAVIESGRPAGRESGPASAASRIESECEVVAAATLAAALPEDRRSVESAMRTEFHQAVVASAAAFYEDPVSGRKELESHWSAVRENPGLLPTERAERNRFYRSLAVLLLARYNDSQGEGDELATWLANHLPDQVPSAKQLPPKLSVRAAEALGRAHAKKGTLTVGAPRDCVSASLLLDGRTLGTLPLRDVPVHMGRHAVWFECGDKISWTRMVEMTDTVSLPGPHVGHEAVFLLSDGRLRLRTGIPSEEALEPARRLLTPLGVDAVVVIPSALGGEALVLTAGGEKKIPLAAGPVVLSLPREVLWPRPWSSVAKWVVAGVSVAALGAGMTAHALYDREIDSMRYGTVDGRGAADSWRGAAIGGYATAATAAAGAAVLFFVDGRPEPPVDPLFPGTGAP